MAVLGSQVQGGLPVPVPGIQVHAALRAQELHRMKVAGDARQVQRGGPKVVGLLWVKARIDEHLHEWRVALVGGPVEGGVPVHVGELGLGPAAEKVRGHELPTKHAGHHQGSEPFVVGSINRNTRLKVK